MTYVASVIASNPDHYWRLNEGPGATATLDYGNVPGMLWQSYAVVNGIAQFGPSGFGFGGITSDGGAMNTTTAGLWSKVATPVTSTNPYVSFQNPGTLEFWMFNETPADGFNLGWIFPHASGGQQGFSFSMLHNNGTFTPFTDPQVSFNVAPLSQWHHIAASWSGTAGFIYLDGTQVQPLTLPNVASGNGGNFIIGSISSASSFQNQAGLVTEVATYRRALSVGDLDAHFDQAELKGQRPHWIGPRQSSSNSPVTIDRAYSVGVTHLARTGSSSFSVPTGLRGFMIDIVDPKPPGRVSAGTPPYLWDVGWVSILDANGMLAERRPNRDRTIWLPDGAELATVFTHDLLPGWTIDVSELDPA